MAASTTLLTSIRTLQAEATAPTAATLAKADAAGMDYFGMTSAALAALSQAWQAVTQIKVQTDSADPNLTTPTNVLLSLS